MRRLTGGRSRENERLREQVRAAGGLLPRSPRVPKVPREYLQQQQQQVQSGKGGGEGI
jgi:hypothetical protein